jgi:hypothetical protein
MCKQLGQVVHGKQIAYAVTHTTHTHTHARTHTHTHTHTHTPTTLHKISLIQLMSASTWYSHKHHSHIHSACTQTDLHVHLDGSLRLGTVIDLAAKAGVHLPSTDPDELRRTVFKSSYHSLEDYLECFK